MALHAPHTSCGDVLLLHCALTTAPVQYLDRTPRFASVSGPSQVHASNFKRPSFLHCAILSALRSSRCTGRDVPVFRKSEKCTRLACNITNPNCRGQESERRRRGRTAGYTKLVLLSPGTAIEAIAGCLKQGKRGVGTNRSTRSSAAVAAAVATSRRNIEEE